LQKDKVRVYILARELNLESKDLIDLCAKLGLDVKNQLSNLEPNQVEQIVTAVKRGPASAPPAPAPRPSALPRVNEPIRKLDSRRPAELPRTTMPASPAPVAPPPVSVQPTAAVSAPAAPASAPQPAVSAPAAVAPAAPVVRPPEPVAVPAPRTPEAPVVEVKTPSVVEPVKPSPAEAERPRQPEVPAARQPEPAPPAAPRPPVPQAPPKLPTSTTGAPVRNLGGPPRGDQPRPGPGGGGSTRTPRVLRPPTQRPVVAPPRNKPLTGTPPKKADQPAVQQATKTFTPEMLKQMVEGKANPLDIINQTAAKEAAGGTAVADTEEEEGADGKKTAKRGPGGKGVAGRDKRQEERNKRAKERKREPEVAIGAGGKVVTIDEEDRRRRPGDRLRQKLKQRQQATMPRKGKVPVDVPITVRSLSEAMGVKHGELLFKLMGHGMTPGLNINSTLDPQMAELVALDFGRELDIKKPLDAEEQLIAESKKEDPPESLVPRAPIVTIMGHVDHGKTSLLDRIRKSNVVATEAGGITQVLRAWRVEHGGRPITFLDTPGHEAFTKMRARGAQVTDIAVIVVAAEDGVMPQTEEAINHAKAAGVSLVVAINKVDLPNANVNRTRQQLYGLNVLPDNMGGDTPFVETSAATGKGIDELLDQISIVAELKELKANPNKPAHGTCLEVMLSEDEGVRATLLVQEGTLHRHDVILCGSAFGRVRQMYDDQGRPIDAAGPSVPVRITGLDIAPNADDPFQVAPDLAVARDVAEKRRLKQQEAAISKRAPVTLEMLTQAKIAELKIILKADTRGSIEAIRKEMEKLTHEEVRVRILEAAIGAITENDVWLALTSPEDTLIVGFNAVPDDRAKTLAEERGVKILQYDIIYNLTKDIRSALEGKLKPREEVVNLGRAVVRDTFKISRVGTIAGCYVTQGTIKRSAKVRLIREGVVIFPPAGRSVGLESLKRFKEDAGEVREGFECGIKIAGYDDVKVGDVIEAYRVDQVVRTL
jgi:translation initiation factor IF-2